MAEDSGKNDPPKKEEKELQSSAVRTQKVGEQAASKGEGWVAANAGARGMVAAGGKAETKAPVPAAGIAGKLPGDRPRGGITRRGFFSWLGLGWLGYIATSLAGTTALLRFMLPNVLFEPPMTFRAGRPEEFAPGQVDERFKDAFGVWIVRLGDTIFALSTVCTHLGCTPNWLAAEEKFKCPCHGSGFYITGIHFEGPAPRPLERYKVTLSPDGFVMVDKTRIFQQEKGDWGNTESFIQV